MNLLLDTHVLIWWLMIPERLIPATWDILEDESNRLFVSVASIWEMAIKTATGRLAMPDRMMEILAKRGATILRIEADHAFAAATLPPLHKDPFDRMLVAQAMHEGLTLVTRDALVTAYPVAILLA